MYHGGGKLFFFVSPQVHQCFFRKMTRSLKGFFRRLPHFQTHINTDVYIIYIMTHDTTSTFFWGKELKSKHKKQQQERYALQQAFFMAPCGFFAKFSLQSCLKKTSCEANGWLTSTKPHLSQLVVEFQPYHPWDERYIYRSMDGCFFMVNVGKYTIHIIYTIHGF